MLLHHDGRHAVVVECEGGGQADQAGADDQDRFVYVVHHAYNVHDGLESRHERANRGRRAPGLPAERERP
ncbi:hypothetical protein Athai_63420 [Actinocatenispora thailandica]|uniref:Uncharacterized protein n=1 Tax=Actinocatenispora thailandica TaxID=227318 RepID=A0A7R7I0S8_9ACTN|nr:hypothetical protein Athai_63420 [Actinocatenispora thailandica]